MRATAPYRVSQRTSRPAAEVLDDLTSLAVPGATVAERGQTYLVFAPRRRPVFGPGRAVFIAALITLAVLVVSAYNVVLIALLPVAAVPLLALLLEDEPTVAVGAVGSEGGAADTRVTVHGRTWGALEAALDAYLTNLPEATTPPDPEELEIVASADLPVAAAAGEAGIA